jgi:hypothetical protein
VTARLAVRRRGPQRLVLVTKLRKRMGFGVGFALLLVAMLVSFDAGRDLTAERAPLTVLYVLLLLGSLGGCLATRVFVAEAGVAELVSEQRVAGLRIRLERLPVAGGAEVRVRRVSEGRGVFVLEVGPESGATVLDSSSWRSELEPTGRLVAEVLGIPFRAPER